MSLKNEIENMVSKAKVEREKEIERGIIEAEAKVEEERVAEKNRLNKVEAALVKYFDGFFLNDIEKHYKNGATIDWLYIQTLSLPPLVSEKDVYMFVSANEELKANGISSHGRVGYIGGNSVYSHHIEQHYISWTPEGKEQMMEYCKL